MGKYFEIVEKYLDKAQIWKRLWVDRHERLQRAIFGDWGNAWAYLKRSHKGANLGLSGAPGSSGSQFSLLWPLGSVQTRLYAPSKGFLIEPF